MAEDRDERTREDRPEETRQTASARKKKKSGKGFLFFALLFLILGGGAGLHFSGRWDARPLVWGIIPQIPYVGRPIANFFGIPPQYTLTAEARRTYELDEWQKRLDERERRLGERDLTLQVVSDDLGRSATRQAQTPPVQSFQPAQPPDADRQQRVNELRQRFQEMSSRPAAQIIEQMEDSLAVDILRGLSTDASAAILVRMDPRNAARLSGLMVIN